VRDTWLLKTVYVLLNNPPKSIAVDLSDVTLFSINTIKDFLTIGAVCAQKNVDVVVTNANASIKALIQKAGIADSFNII